jgi:hypothetical protein
MLAAFNMNRWHPAVKPGDGRAHVPLPLEGAIVADLTSGIAGFLIAGPGPAVAPGGRPRGARGSPGA